MYTEVSGLESCGACVYILDEKQLQNQPALLIDAHSPQTLLCRLRCNSLLHLMEMNISVGLAGSIICGI